MYQQNAFNLLNSIFVQVGEWKQCQWKPAVLLLSSAELDNLGPVLKYFCSSPMVFHQEVYSRQQPMYGLKMEKVIPRPIH